jgi:tRNA (guanine-N7-)-methyltransferase
VPKKKLIHFQENLTFPHLFQPRYHDLHEDFFLRSKWHKEYFRNTNPLIIELGCGKGEYTVGLAMKYPEKNFIGIDLKGARLWRGCKTAEEKKLSNVAFIRTRVDFLEKLFSRGEVDEIWITFPDPQPGRERKRLTSPVFLCKYAGILNDQGIIHLKTDSFPFYEYTLEVISAEVHQLLHSCDDLYNSGLQEDANSFQTYYEKIWLEENKKICYLRFMLTKSIQHL